MLLKELTLVDFRQFKGKQKIIFSENKSQNVTIIIGENGTGKTTFAQAFTWCLYGETSFSDKKLLCNATEQEMKPDDEKKVSVTLKLIHANTEYVCCREQTYYKDVVGTIKSKTNAKFSIGYKGKDGQQEFIKDIQLEGKINEILPKELSGYFFFDGERIGNMSKEIREDGKSKEFPSAVKRLLGLAGFEKALYHLNGSQYQNSVVKSYKRSFDSTGNEELRELMKTIDSLSKQKNDKEHEISKIEDELNTVLREQNRLEGELNKISSIEALLSAKKNCEDRLASSENLRQIDTRDLLKNFSDCSYNFFAHKLISDAVELLSKANVKDSGIPDIHKRTIDFLINRGFCVCGTKIEKGSDVYRHLIEQLQFIPPQSLGTSIRQFLGIANEKTKQTSFYEVFDDLYARIMECNMNISEQNEEISKIDEKLAGSNEATVVNIHKDLKHWQEKENELFEKRGKCNQEITQLENELNGKEQTRSNYTNIGDTNKKISIYLKYAEYIYAELKKQYQDEEAKIREQFETTLNEIFRSIYDGGFSLGIDEKYNIRMIVNDFNGYSKKVEISTAQSYSVILAFISAVIKMARENENGGNKSLVTEPYPLVMDAPLSAFDKTRIQTICDVLPNIAEQVIIFINDKDGEVAEANMQDKIGRRYVFKKENEFETYMEENNV